MTTLGLTESFKWWTQLVKLVDIISFSGRTKNNQLHYFHCVEATALVKKLKMVVLYPRAGEWQVQENVDICLLAVVYLFIYLFIGRRMASEGEWSRPWRISVRSPLSGVVQERRSVHGACRVYVCGGLRGRHVSRRGMRSNRWPANHGVSTNAHTIV